VVFVRQGRIPEVVHLTKTSVKSERFELQTIMIYLYRPQENGGTFIGEDRLVVMAGVELVEWYQIHQAHGLYVLDAVPLAPIQSLL
jgi:hypothetical protein